MKSLTKGLHISNSDINTPEDSYTYGLNIQLLNKDKANEITDAYGNIEIFTFPGDVRGFVLGNNSCAYYLVVNGNTSYIYKQVEDTFTEVFSTNCFTYNIQVKMLHRVVNCKEIIYLYDGVSPDRMIYINEIGLHKDNLGNFICSTFLLKPEYTVPTNFIVKLNETGGDLDTAAYTIVFRYLDELFNPTDWFSETRPIRVNNKDHSNNGATTSSLDCQIINPDTKYKYLEVAVNKYSNNGSVLSYLYGKYLTNSDIFVTITSLKNLETYSYDNVTVPTAKYKTSIDMLQYDNRLLRVNVSEEKYDWGSFQQAANAVKTYWDVTSEAETTLMRDEVYALGIVYLLKDGSESPTFHVPNRVLNQRMEGGTLPTSGNGGGTAHSRPDAITGWDSTIYDNVAIGSDIDVFGVTEITRWEAYNTALNNTSYRTQFGYYEPQDANNNSIAYPNIKDCNGNRIYPTGNIRLHRMPDATLVPHFNSSYEKLYLKIIAENVTLPHEDVVGWKLVYSDRVNDKTILDKGLVTTILEQNFNQNLQDNITNDNVFYKKHYTQSLQFSHDNQTPKSYTLQSSESHFFAAGGNQSFMLLPACADNIAYAKENCEESPGLTGVMTKPSIIGFHSPMSKIRGEAMKGSHVKFEYEFSCFMTGLTGNGYTKSNDEFYVHNNRHLYKNRETKKILYTSVFHKPKPAGVPYSLVVNRKIENFNYTEADSTFSELISEASLNNKTQQEIALYELSGSADDRFIQWRRDDNCTRQDLWNFDKSRWAIPSIYTRALNFYTSVGGNEYDSGGMMSYNYVAIKNYKKDCYRDLTKIKYKDFSGDWKFGTEAEFTGGDVFLSRMAFRQTYFGYVPHAGNWSGITISLDRLPLAYNSKKEAYSLDLDDQDLKTVPDECNAVFEAKIIDFIYETEVDIEKRIKGDYMFNNNIEYSSGTTDPNQYTPANASVRTQLYYPDYYGFKGKELNELELNSNSISRLTNEGEWKFYQLFPNYYDVSQHNYIRENDKVYFALDTNISWCTDCYNKHSNRLVWSEKAYSEKRQDSYRVFKANNYLDIVSNSGSLYNIFEVNQQLYLQSDNNMYALPRTNQTLNADSVEINLGTGDFLSLPPVRLSNLNYSYGGSNSRFSHLNTEMGLLLIDTTQKDLLLFNQGFKVLSEPINRFAKEEFKLFMDVLYKNVHKTDYPLSDHVINTYGIGFSLFMDYQDKIIYLHKKDFKPLLPIGLDYNTPFNNKMYFYNNIWYVYENNTMTQVYFDNVDYFENKCFTLSYDIKYDRWLSFHSFHPHYAFSTPNFLYTGLNSNFKLWKHDRSNKRLYYGRVFASEIEYITDVSANAYKLDNIQVLMKVDRLTADKIYVPVNDKTLRRILLYSDNQSSGAVDLSLLTNNYDTINYSANTKKVKVADNIHRISGLRCYSTNNDVFDYNWASRKLLYSSGEQGYIDKIPKAVNFNTGLNLYNIPLIKDQYVKTRLYFTETSDYRFRLQLFNNNKLDSYR